MANLGDKPLVWLKGEVKTPPFSSQARLEADCCSGGSSKGKG
jgi:hypothetical protein